MDRRTLYNLRRGVEISDPKSNTEKDQYQTELLVRKAYCEKLEKWGENALKLFKFDHIGYLSKKLINLPTNMQSLDASQSWLAYWMVHSLRLFSYEFSKQQLNDIFSLLKSCQDPKGGFGGGPKQLAHLAPTYGAVNCLASLLSSDVLDIIDRDNLRLWLLSLRQPDGSFIMHHGGEVDVRGVYCAVSVASLTGILGMYPDLFLNSAEWIANCQTYEGGFGGQPGLEAHGGYTYCAFAALYLLNRTDLVNIDLLLRWASHRQLATEGGFQGRTHKLVDSCYSFWLGSLFSLIEDVLSLKSSLKKQDCRSLFDTSALQDYILLCCQKVFYMKPGLSVPSEILDNKSFTNSGGGLIDKPGKNVDPYHTCYALSGLSIAQHSPRQRLSSSIPLGDNEIGAFRFTPIQGQDVVGNEWENELADLDPSYNIVIEAVAFTKTYFDLLNRGVSKEEATEQATSILSKISCKPQISRISEVNSCQLDTKVDCQHELIQICSSP